MAEVIALYSASVEEWATDHCFFDLQEMGLGPKKKNIGTRGCATIWVLDKVIIYETV